MKCFVFQKRLISWCFSVLLSPQLPDTCLFQDSVIEVDENGTLDLSMKKKKEKTMESPLMPALGEAVFTPPEASLAKVGGVQISTAFFRAVYEQEGWDMPLNFSKAPLQKDKDVRL